MNQNTFTSFDMAFNDLKAKKMSYEESLNEISMENVRIKIIIIDSIW